MKKKKVLSILLTYLLIGGLKIAEAKNVDYSWTGIVTNGQGFVNNGLPVNGSLQFDDSGPFVHGGSNSSQYDALKFVSFTFDNETYTRDNENWMVTVSKDYVGFADAVISNPNPPKDWPVGFGFSESGANLSDTSLTAVDGIADRQDNKSWYLEVYDSAKKAFVSVQGAVSYVANKYAVAYGFAQPSNQSVDTTDFGSCR